MATLPLQIPQVLFATPGLWMFETNFPEKHGIFLCKKQRPGVNRTTWVSLFKTQKDCHWMERRTSHTFALDPVLVTR